MVTGANSARPADWNLDWSRGRLSRCQMVRVAGQHAMADSCDLRVLVVHHPPASPPNGFHLIDGNQRRLTIRDWPWTGSVYAERRVWEFEADPVTRDWRLV